MLVAIQKKKKEKRKKKKEKRKKKKEKRKKTEKTRAHPGSNRGPTDLQSDTHTTELWTLHIHIFSFTQNQFIHTSGDWKKIVDF